MGFKDLKLLKEKENRIYLILIIWLLVAFTFIQFEILIIAGIVIFLPLIILSFILMVTSFLSFKRLEEMSRKRIFISILIAIPFLILFFRIVLVLFYFAIISYVVITSIFTMFYFYRLGLQIDEYLLKLPSSIRRFERWAFFIGGTVGSIVLLIGASIIAEIITGGTGQAVGFNTSIVALAIVLIIIFLGSIGGLLSLRGRLNSWMGIFFIWIAIYSIYLMISIIYGSSSTGSGVSSNIPIQIVLFVFSLFLILSTTGSIIGERTQLIQKKLKIFKSDTILLWLFFSMASYEFASGAVQTGEVDILKYIVIYVLFIPLLFLMGIYGLMNYGKIRRERSVKQLEQEAKKEGVIEKEEIICIKCGAVIKINAQFCTQCGTELSK
ncbi:MAG: zinc-ribbon domain-containing protein [Candidatus Lokiarchaeota archaeon]|nr:zinc-ribbon domain-containing protein [Candidatus Lokiarchaeota archaeon]MBD3340843.1 zinc-ribbon domain-containing protein [Candidatus Lokiarchaeota archaeon]